MRQAIQPGPQGLQPGGYPASVTLTAAWPGNGAAGDTSRSAAATMPGGRFVNSRAAVIVKPDGTLVPLPIASNTYTVPEGSLLMMSGGPTITLRPGVYTSPYGVITVTSAMAPAAAAAAGPVGSAVPGSAGFAASGPPQATTATLTADVAPASPAVTGPGMVFANLLDGTNPGGPFIQRPPGQQGQQQSWSTTAPTPPGTSVGVFDVNGNPVGFVVPNQVTGTVQLVSPAGSVLGTVQADHATGRLIVVGTNGAALGQLGLNQATGAVTLVTGSPSQAPVTTTLSPGGGADFAVGTPASAATPTPVARPISMVAADPVASFTPA